MKSLNQRNNRISTGTNIMFNIIFILFCFCCIYPMALVIGTSFADETYLKEVGYTVFPKVISFEAYSYIGKVSHEILNAYKVTIIVTVIGTVLSTLFISLFAYAITRPRFKGRRVFTFIMFFTMLFNGGMVPWYIICTNVLRIQNTMAALIWPSLVSAWSVMIMKTYFITTVPDSIIESAKIDGARELTVFFKIVFPISLPGFATIALFSMLGFWNDWYLPLMLTTNPELTNLQYYLYRILANLNVLTDASTTAYAQSGMSLAALPKESARMAICVIAVGPIIFAYPFFQKYFIQGLTIGSVKG